MRKKISKENYNYSAQVQKLAQQSPTRKHFGDISNCASPQKSSPIKKFDILDNQPTPETQLFDRIHQIQFCSREDKSQPTQQKPNSQIQKRKEIRHRSCSQGRDSGNRKRQFDLKMFNIGSIDEQIGNLLQMVRNSSQEPTPKHLGFKENAKRVETRQQNNLKKEIKNKQLKIMDNKRRVSRKKQNCEHMDTIHERQAEMLTTQNSNKNLWDRNLIGETFEERLRKMQRQEICTFIQTDNDEKTQQRDHQIKDKALKDRQQPIILNTLISRKLNIRNPESDFQKNIDEGIIRIKERIQHSQKTTKDMEEKYLGSCKIAKKIQSFDKKEDCSRQNSARSSSKSVRRKNIAKRCLEIQQLQRNQSIEESCKEIFGRRKATHYSLNKTGKIHFQNFELNLLPCDGKKPRKGAQNFAYEEEMGRKIEEQKGQVSKKIAYKILQQVKLDQKLKQARQQFIKFSGELKWKKLRESLNKYGYQFTEKQLITKISLSPNQISPFQSPKESYGDCIGILAHIFYESEQFWRNNFHKTVGKEEIERCRFTSSELDIDSKGYIGLQDLVCFLNLHTSNFLRSRDLASILKRFCGEGGSNRIQFRSFLSKFF